MPADAGYFSGFVFKIQANMDPNHRDRIAFMRVCSGKLNRGMKAKLVRTGKPISLSAPQFFFAQDRAIADEAFAGDVVGIPNHGTLRIGDTLTLDLPVEPRFTWPDPRIDALRSTIAIEAP